MVEGVGKVVEQKQYGTLIFLVVIMLFILYSAICTVTTHNPVNSVVFLIFTFVASILLLLNLGVEYLALLILLIYVGAISILLLFVVVMTDFKDVALEITDTRFKRLLRISYYLLYMFMSVLVLWLIVTEYPALHIRLIYFGMGWRVFSWNDVVNSSNDLWVIGIYLYNEHFVAVILTCLVLFVTIVASIAIVTSYKKFAKQQIASIQMMNWEMLSLKKDEDEEVTSKEGVNKTVEDTEKNHEEERIDK